MLAVVNPTTTAMTQQRNSLANKTVEGDKSRECLIFNSVKATACLTPTSEKSIKIERSGFLHKFINSVVGG